MSKVKQPSQACRGEQGGVTTRARRLVEVMALTAVYVVTARVGQLLAIPPGNVTAVWIPSGLVIAAIMHRGYRLWPGIFAGAFLGNIWAYFDCSTLTALVTSIGCGVANGLGDTAGTLLGVFLYRRTIGTMSPLESAHAALVFIRSCAVIPSAVSALFGATSLAAAGFVPWTQYPETLLTWWVGDTEGVLLLAPLALSWLTWRGPPRRPTWETSAFAISLAGFMFIKTDALVSEWAGQALLFSSVPWLLWPALQLGQRLTLTAVALTATKFITMTALGSGPFSDSSSAAGLLQLQVFVAVLTVTLLLLLGVVEERRSARQKLQIERHMLEQAQQMAKMGAWQLDVPTGTLTWSDTIQALFGIPANTAKTFEGLAERVHPDDQALFRNQWRSCRAGDHDDIQYRVLTEGATRWFRGKASCVAAESDPCRWVTGAVQDITDDVLVKAELTKAQKLQSLAVVAGGIAHDFNNLLTGVIGNLSLTATRLDSQSELAELIREAQGAAHKAQSLTKQLLTFARGGEPIRRAVNLADLLKETATFAARGSTSRCVFDIEDDLCPVLADAEQLAQVMSNLVINATQAMPGGGVVSISARNQRDADHTESVGGPPHGWVRFTVHDQGYGIADEDLPRIFDPYFSRKATGRGLGLAICYSVVTRHGGRIAAHSRCGQWTAVEVLLPALAADAQHQQHQQQQISTRAGRVKDYAHNVHTVSGRVLVMDDDELVGLTLTRMLEHLGYETELVEDGQLAVDIYTQAQWRGQGFDLVIMDLTIPGGMGGAQAALRLRAFDPEAKLIVSSGYSDNPVIANYKSHGFQATLPKPYTLDNVREAVKLTLGDSSLIFECHPVRMGA